MDCSMLTPSDLVCKKICFLNSLKNFFSHFISGLRLLKVFENKNPPIEIPTQKKSVKKESKFNILKKIKR